MPWSFHRPRERMVEWGQDTDSPGSLARDSSGLPLYTGSSVSASGLEGVVVAIRSPDVVSVTWSDGSTLDVHPQNLHRITPLS